MHGVDRDATRIWHAFHPLALADAYASATDAVALARRLRIDGNPRLAAGQIGSSHRFLYGHRYWPQVTAAVLARLDSSPALIDLVRDVAADAAAAACVDASLVTGIAFVALMTLRQAGADVFRASTAGDDAAAVSTGPSPGPCARAPCTRRWAGAARVPARRQALPGGVRRGGRRCGIPDPRRPAPDDGVGQRRSRLHARAASLPGRSNPRAVPVGHLQHLLGRCAGRTRQAERHGCGTRRGASMSSAISR